MIRLEKLQWDQTPEIQWGKLALLDFADWRDQRLQEVQPVTVIREMQLMSSVLSTARREWGFISSNPLSFVSKPRKTPPRDRLPTQHAIEAMLHCVGSDLAKATARAFHAFRFALETAMRAGETARLEWDRVYLDRRVARLIHTKNGRPRDVPLSSQAVELLDTGPVNLIEVAGSA